MSLDDDPERLKTALVLVRPALNAELRPNLSDGHFAKPDIRAGDEL